MSGPSDILDVVVQVAIAIPIVLLLVSVGFSGSAVVPATTADYTTIDTTVGGIPSSTTVAATSATAIQFDGNGSVESTAPQNLTASSWTVCASGELADGANLNSTYDLFAYDNETVLLQYDAGQWAAYYNSSNADALATLPAPSPRAGFRSVCARYNESADALTISRGDTVSDPVALDSEVDSRNLSWNWEGRIDEVRTFASPLANATLVAYADDPIEPRPGTNRTARFMLDDGRGSTTTVYFASVSSASITDGTWVDGIPGPETDNRWLTGLDRGTDYRLQSTPFAIKLVPGGYLDGAPVVHVSWSDNLLGIDFVGLITAMVLLLILLTIANRVQTYL